MPHRALSVDPSYTPAYLDLLRSGALAARAEEALEHLADCDLCPRYCRVDRYPPLDRALSPEEYARAHTEARRAGLHRFDRPRRW